MVNINLMLSFHLILLAIDPNNYWKYVILNLNWYRLENMIVYILIQQVIIKLNENYIETIIKLNSICIE